METSNILTLSEVKKVKNNLSLLETKLLHLKLVKFTKSIEKEKDQVADLIIKVVKGEIDLILKITETKEIEISTTIAKTINPINTTKTLPSKTITTTKTNKDLNHKTKDLLETMITDKEVKIEIIDKEMKIIEIISMAMVIESITKTIKEIEIAHILEIITMIIIIINKPIFLA